MVALSSRFATLARAARPVVVVVLLMALLMLATLGMRIQSALTELRSEATDNLHWNLSQLEVDLVRLSEEIRVEIHNPTISLVELRKRYDLFYSRAQNAISSRGYSIRGLEDLSGVLAGMLERYLAAETPRIDGPDDLLRQGLPAMAKRLEQLRKDVRATSIQLIDRQAKLADNRRETFSTLVRQVALATATTIGLFVCLLALVVLLNQAAVREARHTEQVSRRLKATVDTALDAIIVSDDRGRIIQFNTSAENTFGYSRHDVMGRELPELIIPADLRAAHSAGMARMRGHGHFKLVDSGRLQTRALNSAGDEFPVELAISSAEGEDGLIFIAFLRDISDRLAAEADLTKARDDALAAERTKTDFLAVMSHEMRTPLNGVIAALEIVSRKVTDPEQAHFIALAQDSAHLLLRHANEVLDINGLESGGVKLSTEDFDLEAHLSRLVEAMRPVCSERGIGLQFNLLTPNEMLHGDPFRLGQIVQNFLSNAAKFVETGGITVEAEISALAEDLREVEIRVIDTGPGIAAEDQERIFNDFVMLDPSFRRTGEGAGLGLAIARRLALVMGGEVGVESEPGQGSCFWLRLPLPIARGQVAGPDHAAIRDSLPALNVLVIEDNATNRAVMDEMLRHLGQHVVMAVDGAKGAAEAAVRRYDLILMDISMPVMDGLAATRLIRAGGASSKARIVAVTAHSLPADMERFRAAGMDDVLVKPISNAALAQILSGETVPQTDAGTTILDMVRITDLMSAVGQDVFARLAKTFLRDGRTQADQAMAAARQQVSADELASTCHEAAGVAAVIGAQQLQAHYSTAENLVRQGKADPARNLLLSDTETLWQKTEDALTALL